MIVCVAEKPSVAREIANILGAKEKKNGYFEGNGYQVTWAIGHLCELKSPDEYNAEWKRWSLGSLPMIPGRFGIKLKDDKGAKKQFKIIEKLLKKAASVINCGDAGQEGELIQRWIYQKAGCKCPVQRLWVSSLTDAALKQGFATLAPQSRYDKLYEAGVLRAIGDWLLGMNATRAYTLKYGQGRQVLSIGRVQTPTLAMVVKRSKEILNFKPEQYWELKTKYRDVVFYATEGKFRDKNGIEKAFQLIQGKIFVVLSVEKKQGNELPPRLFDLTSLQVECNKRFGFSAGQTLSTVQSLYEKKMLTYPRVDTTYLPDDLYPQINGILRNLSGYERFSNFLLQASIPKKKTIFDSKKVTDHHAIIPTGGAQKTMTTTEQRVYDLVVRRFVSAFYPNCQFEATTVTGKVETVEFKATGKHILKKGWKEVWTCDTEKNESEIPLPAFMEGESGVHVPFVEEKWTTPPKYFTEATLLRAMETAGKTVENEELREVMKENGIGRPSTRANIIETLFRRNYMKREGRKNIVATQTGMELIDTINDELLKSAELTGVWENKLRKIEKGDFDGNVFMAELKDMVCMVVKHVVDDKNGKQVSTTAIASRNSYKRQKNKKRTKEKKDIEGGAENESKSLPQSGIQCPVCHSGRIIAGKAAYGCSNWKTGCMFRLPFVVMGHYVSQVELQQLVSGGVIVVNGKKLHVRDGIHSGNVALIFHFQHQLALYLDRGLNTSF